MQGVKPWSSELLEWVSARPHLHLFTDFDGTLAPIAPRPEAARLPERARAALVRLVARPRTEVVVVSGRPIETLRALLPVDGLTLVGNHGMETLYPDGRREEDPLATRARPLIARLGAEVAARASATEGAVLENKGLSLSLHTRLVESDEERARLEREVVALAEAEPALAHSGGKRIVEIRPRGAPHKGDAALRLLTSAHGSDWPPACAALFLGDDLTDEDGFRALQKTGAGIRVLDGTPAPTCASFTASGTNDALAFLEALALSGE